MGRKDKPKKEKQLDLGLKGSPKNLFYKLKSKSSDFLIRFEVKEFLRNPFTWFVIIISLAFIAVQIYILINNISLYPKILPVWQNQISLTKRLSKRESLYAFPIISASILILGILSTNIYYHREKFLSKILLYTIILSITGLTFAFLKLIP